MADYVFTLRNVRKAHGDKVVLDNVTLSFLHGAKIGVVGPNGTGKSTLLKIMAGLEHANNGDAIIDPGATVGMLQQEPPLTEGKTVLENVEEAVARDQGQARPLQRDLRGARRPRRRLRHAARRDGRPADRPRPRQRVGPRQPARPGDGRAALPAAATSLVDNLSGGERRRVALCKLLLQQPDLLLLDEPTNHLDAESVQWLEGHLASYPGAVLAVTHDRYFLDNVAPVDPRARPRQGPPLRGQLLDLPRDQEGPPQDRGPEGRQARQDARARARVGALQRQGPPDQEQVAAGALRGDGGRGRPDAQDRHLRDQHPGRPAARRRRARGPRPRQGLRGPHAHARPVLHAAPRRHRRRDRPQRRRQDHAVPDDHRRGAARRGRAQGRPDREDLLRRPEPRRHRPQQERLGGRLRRARLHQGRQLRDELARLRRVVRLQGPRPAEEGRRALRR